MSARLGLHRNQAIGVAVVVVGVLMWIFAFIGGFAGLFANSTTTVKANFASVEAIVANDPVRINGVEVGTVQSVSPEPGGRGGTVTMSVQSQYHIYQDASASIVWRTILGANDAIAINPGTRVAGPLVGPIQQSRNSNQVELDQVIAPFHGGAQSGLQTMLQQLGPALSNHATLANDLNLYRGIAPNANIAGGALRGQIQDTDLRNLVKNAGQAAQALSVGTNAAETQQFVQSAANTLLGLGGNPSALRGTIQTFTKVYVDGQSYVFPQYNNLLYKVDSIAQKLTGAAPQIVPTIQQFRPTLTNAQTLLQDANPLVHKLGPAIDSLAATARTGVPLITQLNPGLTALAKTTLPGLAAKYPEEGGKSVYQLIGPTAVGLGVLTNFFNSDGELANLTAGLEVPNAAQVLPCSLNFAGADFLVCSSLSDTLQMFFSGGTSLLQSLAKKPGSSSLYGPILQGAQKVESHLTGVKAALARLLPNSAKFLFGGAK
ncbi:MAG: MlaD family protein [Solirubrobacteraceae bacterium]